MPWVKLDDQFPDHEKLAQCEIFAPLCGWLYVCGLAYCNRQLTDGRIPKGHVRRLVNFHGVQYVTGGVGTGTDQLAQFTDDVDVMELAKWLVAVGLWEDADADYLVHDYLSYQPSRAEVLKERADTARRVQQWRGARGKRAVGNSVSNGVGNSVSNGVGNSVSTPSPVPVPDPDPRTQEPRAKNTRAKTTDEPAVVADIWDAWRAACEAVRIAEFASMPVKNYPAAKELLGMATVAEWRRVFDVFLDSPEFAGKRSWGMCLANAPQLLGHVRSNPGQRFGVKTKTASRTDGNDAAATAFLHRLGV